ncbi:MAG: ribbon-helix-helix protein, CopG family [Elusimicrobia bacterium]|nr:ribbon-helix-helix protein, CopG family [Elusimicrobiota bacterium]
MSRTTKVWNISLPPDMAEQAEAVAKKEARTKSELVREALRQYMWSIRWKDLQAYGQKKAKDLGLREEDVEQLVDQTR